MKGPYLNPELAKSNLTVLVWHQPELNLLWCEETQQDYQRDNLIRVNFTTEHLLAATQKLDRFERKKRRIILSLNNVDFFY